MAIAPPSETPAAAPPALWRPRRRRLDGVLTGLAGLCLAIALVPLGAVIGFVVWRGGSRLDGALLTQLPPAAGLAGGGIGNALVGTGIVVAIATLIAAPVGVLAAIYLAEFSAPGPLTRWLRFSVNVLSGVPAILAGVFVYGLLVQTRLTGYSAVAGGVALALLMLPLIIRTTDEALQLIPVDWRWAACSVGARRSQVVFHIVLPAALPAIVTGVTLAIARAAGETAPLIFTALFSSFWPDGVLTPIASLAVLIYNFATAPFEPQQTLAWAAALLLLLLVLVTSAIARLTLGRRWH